MSRGRGGKMTQALYTSCTGLKAGTNQINVVSNNVANMNTTAYKASRVNFETLFYSDLSPSSTASVTSGGINARQVGHGVQIGGITKNLTQGTYKETGRVQDMMIDGNGYFVVGDAEGRPYLTRDGSFTLDSNGDMVTATGMYVMGAESIYSTTASSTKIHLPTLLNMKIQGSTATEYGETLVSEMNDASLTAGTFGVIVNGDDGTVNQYAVTFTQEQVDTMDINTLVAEINKQLGTEQPDGSITPNAYVTASVGQGQIVFTPNDADTAVEFVTPEKGGTNFVEEFGLSSIDKDDNGNYASQVTNWSAVIEPVGSYNDALTLEDWSVNNNGIIQATYSDGSKLSITIDENDQMQWKITTSDFINIIADDVHMNETVLEKANMMLEMCIVVNETGLESRSNNLWEIGVNAGTPYFGMAGYAAYGTIQSGGLEASNVELANELSEMILAQRLVQANSRVFSTADSTLETLVYLGQ